MNIAIFGGTFDPIHTGHAMVANYVAQLSDIDKVWIMVSPQNPLKEQSADACFAHRVEMAKIVASRCPGIEVSEFEAALPSPHFTIDTLRALRKAYPDDNFQLLIGADNFLIFKEWKDWKAILSEFIIKVYPRHGYDVKDMEAVNFDYLKECPTSDVSSSRIREMLIHGYDICYFVPCDVADYIKSNELYVR